MNAPLRHLWLTLLLTASLAFGNETFDQSLSAGKAALEKGDAAAAFAALQRAVNVDPTAFDGYFYLAIASYRLGNFEAAEQYARLASARAPEAERARVGEMLGLIAEKREFAVNERQGDEAYANGLMAKAAESYAKAFRLSPAHGHVGLKAAALYEQMDQLLAAARLWQAVAASGDGASAAAARQELTRTDAALESLYQSEMRQLRVWQSRKDPAALLGLIEALPRKLALRIEAAAIHACRSEVGKAVAQLKEANKLGLKAAQVVDRPEFFGLIEAGRNGEFFATFITEAYGQDALRAMREKAPVPGYAYTVRGLGIDLVPIAPGTFNMGSPETEKGRGDDETLHEVTLSRPYWLAKCELTVRQWQALMEGRFFGDKPDHPQTKSRGGAKEFCAKLTERERAAGRLPAGYVYSLPTEAEWEYAARAGTTGAYAGDLDAMAWYASPNDGPQPVGQKQPNAWGLHDMHGNVAEWCLDSYGPYPTGKVVDPLHRGTGLDVCRGGGAMFTADWARSAARLKFFDFPYIGFRVALRPAS
jgi:formylglycine-generating enzyme required for sulfatase activity